LDFAACFWYAYGCRKKKLSYSRGQKKVGQCFFANVNLLALSMVTMKIFIYYSNPGLLNSILAKFLNKTCPTFFVRDCTWAIENKRQNDIKRN
jgi:hypothetical protein